MTQLLETVLLRLGGICSEQKTDREYPWVNLPDVERYSFDTDEDRVLSTFQDKHDLRQRNMIEATYEWVDGCILSCTRLVFQEQPSLAWLDEALILHVPVGDGSVMEVKLETFWTNCDPNDMLMTLHGDHWEIDDEALHAALLVEAYDNDEDNNSVEEVSAQKKIKDAE